MHPVLLSFYGNDTKDYRISPQIKEQIRTAKLSYVNRLRTIRPDLYHKLILGRNLSGEETVFMGNWFTQAGRWIDKSITQPIIHLVTDPINKFGKFVDKEASQFGRFVDSHYVTPIANAETGVINATGGAVAKVIGGAGDAAAGLLDAAGHTLDAPTAPVPFLDQKIGGIPMLYIVGGAAAVMVVLVATKKKKAPVSSASPAYPAYQPPYQPNYQERR